MKNPIDMAKIPKPLLTKLFILVILFIISYFGFFTKIIDTLFTNTINKQNREFLAESFDQTSKLFITLSITKGLVATIEGSEIGFSVGANASLEIGDIVQPVYDLIDKAWNFTLLSTISIKAQTILLDLTKEKGFNRVISFGFLFAMILIFIKNKNSTFFNLSKRISGGLIIFPIIIYISIPLLIISFSSLSEYINNNYKKTAIVQLETDLSKLNSSISEIKEIENSFNIKKNYQSLKDNFNKTFSTIADITKSLYDSIFWIITCFVIESILFPIGLILIMYQIIKRVFNAFIENFLQR